MLAFLIVAISGRQAAAAVTEANRESVTQAIAATTFALAVAAVWLGCSLAVAELAGGAWPVHRREDTLESFFIALGSRLAVLVATCALGCTLLLAVVYWGAGLKGPWLPMWGVLMIASAVCLLVGLLISTVVKNWQSARAGLTRMLGADDGTGRLVLGASALGCARKLGDERHAHAMGV